jgi:hypothetical protein
MRCYSERVKSVNVMPTKSTTARPGNSRENQNKGASIALCASLNEDGISLSFSPSPNFLFYSLLEKSFSLKAGTCCWHSLARSLAINNILCRPTRATLARKRPFCLHRVLNLVAKESEGEKKASHPSGNMIL